MPIYDYSCNACGHLEEDLYFSISELPKVRACSKCGAHASTQHFAGVKRLGQITSAGPMYGVWQPAAGRVFNTYEEKVAYLKKHNLRETNDPVGGSRSKRREEPTAPKETASWVEKPLDAMM
jgi:putative FmdB family regulatory protein